MSPYRDLQRIRNSSSSSSSRFATAILIRPLLLLLLLLVVVVVRHHSLIIRHPRESSDLSERRSQPERRRGQPASCAYRKIGSLSSFARAPSILRSTLHLILTAFMTVRIVY